MENTPVPPVMRTTKVRAAKAAVSKSGSKAPAVAAAAPTTKRKILAKKPAAASVPLPVADLTAMIAVAAYYLAERRQFAPGNELDDWLAAEQQLQASSNSH